MAYVWADRVLETSTTTGVGPLALAGAVDKHRTFASVSSVADTLPYVITHLSANEWEVGLGTYSAANELTRTTVQASSNAGAAVNFSAGTKRVGLSNTAQSLLPVASGGTAAATAAAARTNLGLVAGGAGDIWVEKAGDTMTGNLIVGSGVGAGDANIEIGQGRSSDGNVYIDLHAQAGSDFDARFVRQSGANGLSQFEHNGTGDFRFINSGAAAYRFHTSSTDRGGFTAAGDWQVGGANTVIDSDRLFRLRQYTVATLPTVGTAGRLAAVTDADTPTYNATIVGSGAVNVPVYDNGTNWVAH